MKMVNLKRMGLVGLVCGVLAGSVSAQAVRIRRGDSANSFRDNPKTLTAFKDVVAGPSQSVVRVLCDGKDAALGTIVDADGYVLTKHSELNGEISVRLKDGRVVDAELKGFDAKTDLAMLKVKATGLKPVTWGENKNEEVGNLLAAPGIGDEPVAVGVLSVASRAVKARDLPAPTPPANSGFLGVGLEEADGGARIMQVVPNSAAAKAGLKVDDVVTLIAETPIIDSETMVNTIQHHKPGDVIPIKLKRGEKEMEVKAVLDKRMPEKGADRRDFQNNMGSVLSNRRGGFPAIIQHDMVLRPMDCGGPLIDLEGKTIGINIARAGRVESYAIPSETVLPLIAELKSGKKVATTGATTGPTTKPVK